MWALTKGRRSVQEVHRAQATTNAIYQRQYTLSRCFQSLNLKENLARNDQALVLHLPGVHSVCRPCYSSAFHGKDAEISSDWTWGEVTLEHRTCLVIPPLAPTSKLTLLFSIW